jgi:peptidyl-prolyl cis-trans isomerase D
MLQRREVQLQRFETSAYLGKVNPSDADIEAFYKGNQALFKAPELATIEYVVLNAAALGKDVAVAEADAQQFYKDNAARWTQPEERRASHILLKNEGDKQVARAQAEAVLAQLRKAPATFAETAKKLSQDPGSASRGGDLDFFGRGAMTPAFEEAVYKMKVGDISDIVETDFGLHIIQLVAVRGGEKKPFEAVRADIEAELRTSQAQKRFTEAAEQFTNMVYEQAESLQPVVDKFKLDKQTATVQRTPAPGAAGALASAKLLTAVFGADAVSNKRNTDAVEVGPGQLAAARVVQHQAARVLPLTEVKAQARERLVAQQAAQMARTEGAQRLASLQKAPAEALPTTLTISRNQVQGLPRQVLDAALRADAKKLPAVVGVDLGDQGYTVVKVVQVLARDTPPAADAPLQQQYNQAWANAEAQAYLAGLKRRFKVEIKEAVVAAAANAASAP